MNKKVLKMALIFIVPTVVLVLFALRLGNNETGNTKKDIKVDFANIDLVSLNGEKVNLADSVKNGALIHFWNTWCIPCKEEFPEIKKFLKESSDEAKENPNSEIPFIAIVREDSKEAVEEWVKENDLSWTILLDPKNKAAIEFGTTDQPETYAINSKQIIKSQNLGSSLLNDFKELKACAQDKSEEPCRRS